MRSHRGHRPLLLIPVIFQLRPRLALFITRILSQRRSGGIRRLRHRYVLNIAGLNRRLIYLIHQVVDGVGQLEVAGD